MFDLLTTNNEAIVKAAQRYLSYLCLTIILTWIPTNEDRFKAVKTTVLVFYPSVNLYVSRTVMKYDQHRHGLSRLPSDTGSQYSGTSKVVTASTRPVTSKPSEFVPYFAFISQFLCLFQGTIRSANIIELYRLCAIDSKSTPRLYCTISHSYNRNYGLRNRNSNLTYIDLFPTSFLYKRVRDILFIYI